MPYLGQAQLVFEARQDVSLAMDGSELQLPWNGGLNSSQYNKVDLDGDGIQEVVVYDRSANIYLIYKIIDGEFVPADELCYLLPDIEPGWVLFVDYNGDGKKDIFSNGSRGVVVYRQVGEQGLHAEWVVEANPLLTTGFSGKINLIANAADVPAITDIDNDGDIDILVYNFAIGGFIRYNKNLSQELYGHSDSLDFEIATRRWGEFEECDCNQFAFSGEACEDIDNVRVQHAGGKALLAFDNDGDGDMDLLAGHEQCIELYFYENMGNQDSAYMVDYSNSFPDSGNPANFHIFPTGFMEDLDFDGRRDLIVTPSFEENYEYKIDFANSNWFYKNTGSNEVPVFEFQQSDFLQDQMLDLGEQTVPHFADLNADSKQDLLVAANGYWNGEYFSGYVVEAINTGAEEAPAFNITNSNFLDLSSLNLINPKISLVDFDGDGSDDLTYSGIVEPNGLQSWLFVNQAETDEQMRFDIETREELNLPSSMTISDSPAFFDVDQDGFVDLLVGKGNGALEYHQNNGSNNFDLVDEAFLGIERDFSLEKRNLVASIGDLDRDGASDLIATDSRGNGRVYFDFQAPAVGEPTSVDFIYKNEVSNADQLLKFDQKSWVATADIFGIGSESLVVGGVRGGVQLFENISSGDGGDGDLKLIVRLYPNPIADPTGLNIESNQNAQMEVISLLGQIIIETFEVNKFVSSNVDVGHLNNGTYILRSKGESGITNSQLFMIMR